MHVCVCVGGGGGGESTGQKERKKKESETCTHSNIFNMHHSINIHKYVSTLDPYMEAISCKSVDSLR